MSMPEDDAARDRIEAAAFRRLVIHLQQRSDVQNIDLMGSSGFCRNCLGDWLHEAAQEAGLSLSKEAARDHVHGMPTAQWKAQHGRPATQDQLDRMAESLAKNEAVR